MSKKIKIDFFETDAPNPIYSLVKPNTRTDYTHMPDIIEN